MFLKRNDNRLMNKFPRSLVKVNINENCNEIPPLLSENHRHQKDNDRRGEDGGDVEEKEPLIVGK
jgi:hypothetical protein